MWEGGITPARDAMTALTQQKMYFFPVTIRYLFFYSYNHDLYTNFKV